MKREFVTVICGQSEALTLEAKQPKSNALDKVLTVRSKRSQSFRAIAKLHINKIVKCS